MYSFDERSASGLLIRFTYLNKGASFTFIGLLCIHMQYIGKMIGSERSCRFLAALSILLSAIHRSRRQSHRHRFHRSRHLQNHHRSRRRQSHHRSHRQSHHR